MESFQTFLLIKFSVALIISMNFERIYHNTQYLVAVLHISNFWITSTFIKRARDKVLDTFTFFSPGTQCLDFYGNKIFALISF